MTTQKNGVIVRSVTNGGWNRKLTRAVARFYVLSRWLTNGSVQMKQAKIIEGEPFDWKRGAEAMSRITDDDGETINWGAAFAADPGVTKCPNCKTFFWAEGTKLECTECGTQFPTRPPR